MNAAITWTTTDLSRARIAGILGSAWVAGIEAKGREAAIVFCSGRARGAWDANERESHAAYRSLAALLAA